MKGLFVSVKNMYTGESVHLPIAYEYKKVFVVDGLPYKFSKATWENVPSDRSVKPHLVCMPADDIDRIKLHVSGDAVVIGSTIEIDTLNIKNHGLSYLTDNYKVEYINKKFVIQL